MESKQNANQIRMSEAKDDWKPLRKMASQPADKYRIGEIGDPWGVAEKKEWLDQTTKKRSYLEEVVTKYVKIDMNVFEVRQYGALSTDPAAFPLLAAISKDWDSSKPCVLVTGGVHGYETSGVQGTLLFAATTAVDYAKQFNIVVCPCVSPWGYERVERWNPICLDPNRSFGPDESTHTEESAAVIKLLDSLEPRSNISEGGVGGGWICHLDCHETTDTDETEFMPARAALVGSVYKRCEIPDGERNVERGVCVCVESSYTKPFSVQVSSWLEIRPRQRRNGTRASSLRWRRSHTFALETALGPS